jgi:hypothetical protein
MLTQLHRYGKLTKPYRLYTSCENCVCFSACLRNRRWPQQGGSIIDWLTSLQRIQALYSAKTFFVMC